MALMIDDIDKKVISLIQGDLPLDERPFAIAAKRIGLSEEEFIERVRRLKQQGIIRRFGATLRHQEAGFSSNAMIAWRIPEDRVDEAGQTIASFRQVTHCYHRLPKPQWPYNVYSMVHGSSREECFEIAEKIAEKIKVKDYLLLFSEKEFKKTSMQYFKRPTMRQKSEALFKKAKELIPGGVNSPVRAGKAVGINPPFISRGEGCYIWDEDGNQYIDYVASWGPMILGHAHPEVVTAIKEAAENGTSYGAPTRLEVSMAEIIVDMVPSVEMVRMVNSGTEATMSAIRLARGYTGRDKIIKFDGCYHGHGDCLLVSAGSGVATLGIPGSPGIPEDMARHTISLPFNDLEAVEDAYAKFQGQIAAIIVEPIPGNMGVVLPKEGFLEGLRQITADNGSLLIFDEVITGFRVGPGGAQQLFNIEPDLTCLGKIIGGGLPVGAYGGKKHIMERMAPEGDIYQAGTLSGNPLAMAAGLTTLRILKENDIYGQLEARAAMLFDGLSEAARKAGIKVMVNRVGSMGALFFTDRPVMDFASAKASDEASFKRYFKAMLDKGVYLAPSAYEASFVSIAHDDGIIEKTVQIAEEVFRSI